MWRLVLHYNLAMGDTTVSDGLCHHSVDLETHSIPSIIKWTGGKRSQAAQLAKFMPSYNKYFEPFLGGGAMLYLAAHRGAVANDIYRPLIDLWKLIQSNPEALIKAYTKQWEMLSADLDAFNEGTNPANEKVPATFYRIRDKFNMDPNPIDLNFLMRTCVNGIIRFNSKQEFNNSFHLSRRGMHPDRLEKIINKWSSRIVGVEFLCHDYKEVLETSMPGDLVYLDPPYAGTKQRYAGLLSPHELFSELEKLNFRGVKWMLSYDGKRGHEDLTYAIPTEIYAKRYYLTSGISAVKKVLGGKNEQVKEALYLNF